MITTTTRRLIITPAREEDAPFFYDLLNSVGWKKYIGDRKISDIGAALTYLQTIILPGYEQGLGFQVFRIKQSGLAAGICGFAKRQYLACPDLGFAILPYYEGRGYTQEAAEAMLEYGYTRERYEDILAITQGNNLASQHLLRKLGFSYEKKIMAEGEYLDLYRHQKSPAR